MKQKELGKKLLEELRIVGVRGYAVHAEGLLVDYE
jgi:hypothetical protein